MWELVRSAHRILTAGAPACARPRPVASRCFAKNGRSRLWIRQAPSVRSVPLGRRAQPIFGVGPARTTEGVHYVVVQNWEFVWYAHMSEYTHMPASPEVLITVEEAAERLGLSTATVRRRCASGSGLPEVLGGVGSWRPRHWRRERGRTHRATNSASAIVNLPAALGRLLKQDLRKDVWVPDVLFFQDELASTEDLYALTYDKLDGSRLLPGYEVHVPKSPLFVRQGTDSGRSPTVSLIRRSSRRSRSTQIRGSPIVSTPRVRLTETLPPERSAGMAQLEAGNSRSSRDLPRMVDQNGCHRILRFHRAPQAVSTPTGSASARNTSQAAARAMLLERGLQQEKEDCLKGRTLNVF